MEILLTVKSKSDSSVQNFTYVANGALVLGRGPDCAVLLDGTGISREHTAMQWEDSAMFVTDLSTNGTWVNGKRIGNNRKCKVEEGDSIELPGYEIRYRMSGPGQATGSAPMKAAAADTAPPKPAARPVPSAARGARAGGAGRPSRSSMPGGFTMAELFLMLVAVAALTLLIIYWIS